MPGNVKKGIKDFTPEERQTILERAKKIEIPRVAKEFDTNWQTISAIVKLSKAEEKAATPRFSAPATLKILKKSKDFTPEEKAAIMKRAEEIGVANAAREAGTSRWVITEWRRGPRNYNNRRPKPQTPAGAVKPVSKPVVSVSAPVKKVEKEEKNSLSFMVESLKIENAILKEKVATLSGQLAKLKSAVGNLM